MTYENWVYICCNNDNYSNFINQNNKFYTENGIFNQGAQPKKF
jgi:hypothetical protein